MLEYLFFCILIKNMNINRITMRMIMSRTPITATDAITGRLIWSATVGVAPSVGASPEVEHWSPSSDAMLTGN